MTRARLRTSIAAAVALLTPTVAVADDNTKPTTDTAKKADPAQRPDTKQNADTKTPKPAQRTSSEIMRITQQTLGHVNAAVTALDNKDSKAAKTALDKAESVLRPLFDTPPLMAILNEIDEAIASAQNKRGTLKTLDLAPLAASVSRFGLWMDPSVAARIEDAKTSANKGDSKETVEALRLARNRIAIDVAFLPVEEAYIRIGAAQHALDDNDTAHAKQLLRTLPIVVSEVQVSTPLVPVRFSLNAAALAAEEGNWQRSRTLLHEATKEMREVEKLSKGTSTSAEASALVDDLEALERKMRGDQRPQPKEIRDLAQRTRDLGA